MKKIGILTCIHASQVCTGAGCLKAFLNRTDGFSRYGSQVQLLVFMSCNGCKEEREQEPEQDDGILEKLERIEKEGIETIHIGACRFLENGEECPRLLKICRLLERQGVEIVRGTHKETPH